MWLLSLKIALRPNKRFLLTILGVAVCLMYVSGTAALVEGLEEGRKRLQDEQGETYYLCSEDPDLSASLFTRTEMAGIAVGLDALASLDPNTPCSQARITNKG